MRIRLSKRGWNNVLIFASMFMILLFNHTHKMFVSGDENTTQQFLLPVGGIVQTVDFSGIKLERIGTTWRIESKISEPKMGSASDYVQAWLDISLTGSNQSPELSQSSLRLPVVVWLAGNAEGRVFEAYLDKAQELAYIFDHTHQLWFALSPAQLHSLIPTELLRG